MITKHQKFVRIVICLLISLCIAPHQALGRFNLDKLDNGVKPIPAAAARHVVTAARLITRGNLPVLVNGYGSYTGATVLTGATIQTPGGVRATVQVGEMGIIDLSPDTIAIIDFDNGNVKGMLKRGCAVLTTYPNINGLLIVPDGTSMTTDKANRSSVTACSENDPSSIENDATNSANRRSVSDPWIFGLNPASTIAMIGAGSIFAANRGRNCCCCCCCGRNPSPSNPQDCGCH